MTAKQLCWKRWYAKASQDADWQARRRVNKAASYLRTKEKRRAVAKRWAENNRDKSRATWRRFYQNHTEAERQRSAQRTPEKKREYAKRNYDTSPKTRLDHMARVRKRQALLRHCVVGPVNYEAIVRDSCGLCAICSMPVIYEPAHIDHAVPLAAGGTHTQDNLQFTHARCNLAKGAKLLRAG